ncbi:MAG: hypothetical protein JRN15_04320, partial [Nitrososphaerota archaeon]|nr:hypothetical protein [Nitrososphaerota archaeon]
MNNSNTKLREKGHIFHAGREPMRYFSHFRPKHYYGIKTKSAFMEFLRGNTLFRHLLDQDS